MSTLKGLLVQPNGDREFVDIEDSLEALQAAVGGYIEFVFVTNGVHAYVNEEGLILGLAPNPVATRYAGYAGVAELVGPVLFLGDGPDGTEADLPPEWLRLQFP